jgi:hypothetical protein
MYLFGAVDAAGSGVGTVIFNIEQGAWLLNIVPLSLLHKLSQ